MKYLNFYLVMLCFTLLTGCTKKAAEPTPEEDPTQIDKSANLRAAGDSANDILSNDTYSKIKIEIAYVQGFRPTQVAIDEFVTYLKNHTFKEDVELVYSELVSPGKETLSIQEIADLEEENRTVYNTEDTLAVYIYFADAPSDTDDEDEGLVTLGAVYRNTTMVIHKVTVERLAGLSVSITTADIETATINHEFGHLFGLVNLGTAPVNDHEDAESENHCNIPGCLMRAELQFSSSGKSSNLSSHKGELKSSCSLSGKTVLKMLENRTAKGVVNAVPLDAECIRDLQSNGGR